MVTSLRILLLALGMGLPLWVGAALSTNGMPPEPRQRVLLDDGWRFRRGEPPHPAVMLDYDVRPALGRSEDGKDADSRPRRDPHATAHGDAGLKRWILPAANPFIADHAKHHLRPSGDPGGELPELRADFDDSDWQPVRVPHDWASAGPFLAEGPYGGMGRLSSWGVGWYRRKLDIPFEAAGRSIFLDIDGAMSYATVWLNGHLVGGWPYGYNGWRVDLSAYAQPGGDNQLAIRLDNPPESARWYPGAGLYRNVWLNFADPVHVGHWGTRLTTPQVSRETAALSLAVDIDNESAEATEVEVATAIYPLDIDGRSKATAVAHIAAQPLRIEAGSSARISGSTTLRQPMLWGPPPTQQPNRYLGVTTVSRGGRIIDRYCTPFGVRSVRFDPEQGLLVNDERVQIRGVNLHHDLGALGTAFDVQAAGRQLRRLQRMGANAVRMSHNPPAPELLELADRMGLLVLDEVFDSWQMRKTALDFHLVFDDWHEADLRAMLRRDRNHPSVVLWSIGNEVGEQYSGEDGAAIAHELVGIAHDEDPTRPVTAALNYAKPEMPLPAELDVIGLNYQGEGIRQEAEFEGTDRIRTPPQYDAFHARFPNKAILGTETASAFSSRGIYLFPVSAASSAPVRDGAGGDPLAHQVSAYELHAVDFGASADKVFAALDRHSFVAGEFVWTGFDYLGEPTPYYSSRSSYSGIIDLAGFPKDRYWLYQSRWRAQLPMAHLLPHWTWPGREGRVTPVHVFTSGDEAELFVNGVSQGRKRKQPGQYRLRWDEVRYQPGELYVRAWRDGKPWAEDRVQTTSPAVRLQLQLDPDAGEGPLAFVQVSVVDAEGRLVPTAANAIRFRLDGPASLLATDNGDPTDLSAFPSSSRTAFSGRALAIVRRAGAADASVVVHAEADGLAPAALILPAVVDPGATP